MTIAGRFRRRLPELSSLWIHYVPVGWPRPESLWLDLSRRSLGRSDRRRTGSSGVESANRARPSIAAATRALPSLDDVLYVPPVAAHASTSRRRLMVRARELGVPMLIQEGWAAAVSAAGSGPASAAAAPPDRAVGGPGADETSLVVIDPLPLLLDDRLEDLARLPAGSRVLFPLIGFSASDLDPWREVCALCARAELAALYPLVLHASALDRRRLGERLVSDKAYRSLFHGEDLDPRVFAGEAARHGLGAIPPRPLPAGPDRRRTRRWLAGELSTAAEHWLALGRPEAAGQALFRAARRLDREDLDIAGSWRDGNLAVLEWLEGSAGEMVAELLAEGRSRLRLELEREYLGL